MSNRLAVFDCDGTLVDSQHNICTAMVRAFEGAKLVPPDRPSILSVVGLSLPLAIARLLPGHEADFHEHLSEQYKLCFQQMRRENSVTEPLYDGIADLVRDLDAQGWLLGVATGKSDRGLDFCLRHHGIHAHFVTLQTADRHPSKPHPSMIDACLEATGAERAHTAMIGDTAYDMEMAVNAGVRAFGVDWGYHHPQELVEAGAEAVAGSMAELRLLLRGME